MNAATIFMLVQTVTCFSGAVGYMIAEKPWLAWIWVCYGLANIGFVMLSVDMN